MLSFDERRILQRYYRQLSAKQFKFICVQPDPYLAGLCVILGLEYPDAEPMPKAWGKPTLRVHWHIGRVIETLREKKITTATAVAQALKRSMSWVHISVILYRQYPDGQIPLTKLATALAVQKQQKQKKEPGASPAKFEFKGPLQTEAENRTGIVRALEKELAARDSQLQAIMQELAAKDERLAAQREALEEFGRRLESLEKTVDDVLSRLNDLGNLGITLADFFATKATKAA